MESRHITAVTQLWSELLGTSDIWLDTSVCVSAFAILWLAMRGEGVTDPVANAALEHLARPPTHVGRKHP